MNARTLKGTPLHVIALLAISLPFCVTGCTRPITAEQPLDAAVQVPAVAVRQAVFDQFLAKRAGFSTADLIKEASCDHEERPIKFDVTQAGFFEQVREGLELSEAELKLLERNGFVSIDQRMPYSFTGVYYSTYSMDLPVLVTTDSILHALHRSFDKMLAETEEQLLVPLLREMLSKCSDELQKRPPNGLPSENYQDVKLYIDVACALLNAPAQQGSDRHLVEVLVNIESLKMQDPLVERTDIYGGRRAIDYSQFQPRGHYTESPTLINYFRTMMWLGRADTGWYVLPPDRQSGIEVDDRRELRNAALFTEVLQSSGAIEEFRQIDALITFMIGQSDNLGVFRLKKLVESVGISGLSDIGSSSGVRKLQDAIRESNLAAQQINSQIVLSDPLDSYQPPPPALFQLFGQRYSVDSFVLSKVVFDQIIYEGKKQGRCMPTALDVAYALGNNRAASLLKQELDDWHYASNLRACRDFVDAHTDEFWDQSLCGIWQSALRLLDDDPRDEASLPAAFRTAAWQFKQLRTQLASWTELRHDTILYTKQSYTGGVLCKYPSGYVEPYPEFYRRIGHWADEFARRLELTDFGEQGNAHEIKHKQIAFLEQVSAIMRKLTTLAEKELAGEPFNDAEQVWLQKTIDDRRTGSGREEYSGWYCELYYEGRGSCGKRDPVVVDLHTDPNSGDILHEAVGDCHQLVLAVDTDDDVTLFVGPTYSYYEFRQPQAKRLTDPEWVWMLRDAPAPPGWVGQFEPQGTRRGGALTSAMQQKQQKQNKRGEKARRITHRRGRD